MAKEAKKVKGVSLSGLTTRQVNSMIEHGKNHTATHLKIMVESMKKGRTFTQSHKIATRKAGK